MSFIQIIEWRLKNIKNLAKNTLVAKPSRILMPVYLNSYLKLEAFSGSQAGDPNLEWMAKLRKVRLPGACEHLPWIMDYVDIAFLRRWVAGQAGFFCSYYFVHIMYI